MRRVVVFLVLIWRGSPQSADYINTLSFEEEPMVRYLLSATMDVLQHTRIELWKLYLQRQNLRGHAAYEIGFLVRTSEERYRKMVDLYNTSVTMDTALRTRDHILHLQKIEKLHWDIMHLANMLHEVERKYKIKPQQMDKRVFHPFGVVPTTTNATTTTEEENTTETTTTTTTTTERTTTPTTEEYHDDEDEK